MDRVTSSFEPHVISRRRALQLMALSAIGAVMASCGGAATASLSPSTAAAPSSAAPATAAPVSAAPSSGAASAAAPKPSASTASSLAASPAASASAAASGGTSTATKAGGVTLPTHIAIQGPQPDVPGSADGNIDPVYKVYPKTTFKSVKQTPGDGTDVSIMSWSGGAPPAPIDQNAAWRAISKDANVNFKLTFVPFADYYTAKLATTIAGGDLPDMLSIINDPTIVLLPEFFDQKCTDLTPYLSGDAVKDYPNLAALPTRPWTTTVFNGKIYGVPQPLRPFFWWHWVHQELLDQTGLQQPNDAQDWKKQLQQLTNPQKKTWGTGVEGGPQYAFGVVNGLMTSIFKAPNNWSVDPATGKFTAAQETDQFKAAVAFTQELYKAGVFDPDGTGWNTLSARDAFIARTLAYRFDGLDANYYLQGPKLDPPANVQVVQPFSNDGSKPVYYFGRPNFGFMVIKKGTSDARVKMLLRVLDYLAAPFGSDEYTLIHYGVKDVDYKLDDKGNPQATDKGRADVVPFNTIVGPTPILYTPLSADKQVQYQTSEKALYAAGLEDASVGLYSRTYATKNTLMVRNFGDGLNAIIQGQRPLADYDQLVKDWLAGGGSQAKTEYQQANAAAKA
jgi:putative aldouronate transport system substrate-binding protein